MEETSTDMEALARRAVACKAWRWTPGMLATGGGRIMYVSEWENATTLPDFTDRATLGCLEGLVAEAWNAPLMYVEPCGGGFEARRFEVCNLLGRVADGFPVEAFVNVSGPTKVAALVLALEAAP